MKEKKISVGMWERLPGAHNKVPQVNEEISERWNLILELSAHWNISCKIGSYFPYHFEPIFKDARDLCSNRMAQRKEKEKTRKRSPK